MQLSIKTLTGKTINMKVEPSNLIGNENQKELGLSKNKTKMDCLAEMLAANSDGKDVNSWTQTLAGVNWNQVLHYLCLCMSDPNATLDYKVDSLTRELIESIARNKSQLESYIKAVPLPNPKVSFQCWTSKQGILAGTKMRPVICPTIEALLGELCKKTVKSIQGWPVPRRPGQNVGQFQSNKGLRIEILYTGDYAEFVS